MGCRVEIENMRIRPVLGDRQLEGEVVKRLGAAIHTSIDNEIEIPRDSISIGGAHAVRGVHHLTAIRGGEMRSPVGVDGVGRKVVTRAVVLLQGELNAQRIVLIYMIIGRAITVAKVHLRSELS